MKKILLIIYAVAAFTLNTGAQNKSHADSETATGSEYIPVEGRSQTGVPKELQGTWILINGMHKGILNAYRAKKIAPGTEVRRDSVTTTKTIDGETHTITEVDVERMGTPVKQITPAQKDNMHKGDKPSISFYGLNETFAGFTGCNKYSGRYKLSGDKIILLDGAASTKMICIGEYDEKEYLNTLKKVNTFKSENGRLQLMNGNEVLLVYERK